MSVRPSLQGLCAIADTSVLTAGRFADAVAAALDGGACMVQYRDKSSDEERRADQAAAVVELCRRHGAVSIVNDDIELALASGADGAHVGRDDSEPGVVRDLLGPDRLLGVSCYNDLARALDAVSLGADYVSFGSVFASRTKPDAVRAPLELITRARRILEVPLCAIGGITAANAGDVFAAGADLVAVIDDLFGAEDIRARAADIAGARR